MTESNIWKNQVFTTGVSYSPEDVRALNVFMRRLRATGCTDIKISPITKGRLAISAVAPEWGMGDQGWKRWYPEKKFIGYGRYHKTGKIIKRRVYYQFWPTGYIGYKDMKPMTHAAVRSRWDLQPAREDGTYRCSWCRQSIHADIYAAHVAVRGQTGAIRCPVKRWYYKNIRAIRSNIEFLNLPAPKDDDYEARGQWDKKVSDQAYREGLRQARKKFKF